MEPIIQKDRCCVKLDLKRILHPDAHIDVDKKEWLGV
jgi:hypothetical protein